MITYYENGIRGDTFNCWLASHNLLSYDRVKKMIKIYREHLPSITPFPEVKEVLGRLKKNFSLGIVTDGYLGIQRKKNKMLWGLRNFLMHLFFQMNGAKKT